MTFRISEKEAKRWFRSKRPNAIKTATAPDPVTSKVLVIPEMDYPRAIKRVVQRDNGVVIEKYVPSTCRTK